MSRHLSARASDNMSVGYFDAHAHLDDEYLASAFNGGTEGAIEASRLAGLCGIVNAGTNVENSRSSISLSEQYHFIYAAVGIYPIDAQNLNVNIDRALNETEMLLSHERVVAVGEIGLDYHYDGTDKARQMYAFEAQLEMAKRYNLPVVIHDREAHGDIIDALMRHTGVRGMLHSFSGSAEMAQQLTDMGFYISFSGTVTYKSAAKVKRAAESVPSNKILTETDSPYLTPVPHRGEVNYPGNVSHTLRALAALRGADENLLAQTVCENAEKLFGISL